MSNLRESALRALAAHPLTLDLGGGRAFQKRLSGARALFEGKRFYSLDLSPERGPDIVGDIQRLPLADGSIEGIVCLSVLEHVPDPWRAVSEMHRILKPGGRALVHVPFLHPDHGTPTLPDYHRFTSDGVRRLFRFFSRVEVEALDDYVEAVAKMATGFRVPRLARTAAGSVRRALSLVSRLVRGRPVGRGRQTTGFDILAVK